MATQYYNKNEQYQSKMDINPLNVSVISGNGQGGSYIVLLGSKFLGANETIPLGTAGECKNKNLQIVVTIQDKLAETNWTGVIVILNENGQTTQYSYAEELPQDLDVASYNINIKIS